VKPVAGHPELGTYHSSSETSLLFSSRGNLSESGSDSVSVSGSRGALSEGSSSIGRAREDGPENNTLVAPPTSEDQNSKGRPPLPGLRSSSVSASPSLSSSSSSSRRLHDTASELDASLKLEPQLDVFVSLFSFFSFYCFLPISVLQSRPVVGVLLFAVFLARLSGRRRTVARGHPDSGDGEGGMEGRRAAGHSNPKGRPWR